MRSQGWSLGTRRRETFRFMTAASICTTISRCTLRPFRKNLEDRFDFDRHVERERPHADGTARGGARLSAEDFNHQLAEAIHDLRLLSEVRRAVHHAGHFNQTRNSIQSSERRPHGS